MYSKYIKNWERLKNQVLFTSKKSGIFDDTYFIIHQKFEFKVKKQLVAL